MDATVRVHIGRLRQKLKEFYETEGKTCPLVVSIPRGSHALEIQFNPEITDPLQPLTPDIHVLPGWNRRAQSFAIAVAILVVVCAAQFVQNQRLAAAVQKQNVPLPRFWQSFLSNGKPTKIFLPMPVFFEWNLTSIKLRDPIVNDFADLESSTTLKTLTTKLGPPRLMQNYTTVGDTMASLKLSQYLQKGGIPLSFGGTTELSVDSLAEDNVILMGTPWVTDKYTKELQENTTFQYTAEQAKDGFKYPILNKHPRGNELARYETKAQSDVRRISFGLISVLPSKGSSTRILSLRERPPLPLVSFLSVPASLELLDEAWRQEGSPEYFEVVVGAELDNGNVLRTWPAAIRAINLRPLEPVNHQSLPSSLPVTLK